MQEYTDKLTFNTLRWIFHNKYEDRFKKCVSAEQMRGLTYKILNLREGQSPLFDRGNRLVDYKAIHTWFHDNYAAN